VQVQQLIIIYILSNVTGTGRNGTANVTIDSGVAVAATILNGGTGYSVGDRTNNFFYWNIFSWKKLEIKCI
jgi:hypothetical protein